MKRIKLFLLMSLPLLAQAQVPDTISGPDGKYEKYYYSAWYDSCYFYINPWGGAGQLQIWSLDLNGWGNRYGVTYPKPPIHAKAEYVPQPSALKGVAVLTTDRRIPGMPTYSIPETGARAADTLFVVERPAGSDELNIIARARWDTATMKILKLPNSLDSANSGFVHLMVYEAYFKNPIPVDSIFYIGGTVNSCEVYHNGIGYGYRYQPRGYAFVANSEERDDLPCSFDSTRIGIYFYLDKGDAVLTESPIETWIKYGCFLPILSYDSVKLGVVSADTTMGRVTPLSGDVVKWGRHTITAYPNTGYKFTHWNDGDTNNPRRVLMDKDSTFIAYFAPKEQYQVAVTVDDPAHGYATGSGTYYELDTMRMEAIPASNQYQFDFWGDGNTANPRLFVVRSDTAFTAFFRNADGIGEVDGTAPLFTLTPNPTQGKVTVTVAQPAPKCELTLRDAAGHEVLRKELSTFNSQLSTTLDLSSLPAGAYFVTLTTPTASSTQRLVVK